MPDKLRKLHVIEREDSMHFEEFQKYDPNSKESQWSSVIPHMNKCYSYHFNIGWQKVSGWSGVCDINDVPVLHEPLGGSYDLRKEVFINILNQFKAELYSKMYNVPIGEAIIKVETGQVDDKPQIYETMNDDGTWSKHTSRCENIDQYLNK